MGLLSFLKGFGMGRKVSTIDADPVDPFSDPHSARIYHDDRMYDAYRSEPDRCKMMYLTWRKHVLRLWEIHMFPGRPTEMSLRCEWSRGAWPQEALDKLEVDAGPPRK